jgi:hypothetical protein
MVILRRKLDQSTGAEFRSSGSHRRTRLRAVTTRGWTFDPSPGGSQRARTITTGCGHRRPPRRRRSDRKVHDMHRMSGGASCRLWLPAWTNAVAKRWATTWGHRTIGTNRGPESGADSGTPASASSLVDRVGLWGRSALQTADLPRRLQRLANVAVVAEVEPHPTVEVRAKTPRCAEVTFAGRAIHSGPDRSPADNHGQRERRLDLRRSSSSQVTAAPDLASGAGGRFRPAYGRLVVPVGRSCSCRGGPERRRRMPPRSVRVSSPNAAYLV